MHIVQLMNNLSDGPPVKVLNQNQEIINESQVNPRENIRSVALVTSGAVNPTPGM